MDLNLNQKLEDLIILFNLILVLEHIIQMVLLKNIKDLDLHQKELNQILYGVKYHKLHLFHLKILHMVMNKLEVVN